MDLGPTLETARLILRPPIESDLDGWARMMADEEAARFVGGVQSRSGSWRGLACMAGSWVLKGFGMFSVIEKESREWVGRLGPWQPAEWPGTEVGWGLVRESWGKGYATEGSTAAMDWAFDSLGWDDIIHCIDPANAGSVEVAKRLGSRKLRKAQLPAPYDQEIDVWGQSRAEWAAGKGRSRT